MKQPYVLIKQKPNACDWIFNFLFFVMLLAILWIGFGIQMTYDEGKQVEAYMKSGKVPDTNMINKKDVQNFQKGKIK